MDEQQLAEQLRDALEHLNDTAYLVTLPLAQQLAEADVDAANSAARGEQHRGLHLRSLLLDLIESLKPPPEALDWAPERRRYTILHNRYVLRQRMWEIEIKLSLSERQVRREHSAAVDMLATSLSAYLAGAPSSLSQLLPQSLLSPTALLQAAIQRLTPAPFVFRLDELFAEVTDLLAQIQPAQIGQLLWGVQPFGLEAYTDRGILMQLLMRLLQRLLSQEASDPSSSIVLNAADAGRQVSLSVAAEGVQRLLAAPQDTDAQLVLWLAQSLHGEISLPPGKDAACLVLPGTKALRRVLVIDDEPASAELFRAYLGEREYQVIAETRAEDALRRVQEVQPDVIVLDVMMPGRGGWEVLQHLRHASDLPARLRDVPIIVYSVLDDRALALALGAARFYRKPILRQQLIQALDDLSNRDAGRGGAGG